MEKELLERGLNMNRRRFLSRLSLGIGSVALGSLMIPDLFSSGGEKAMMTGLRILRRGPNALFIFSRMAHPRSWTCSITNPNCRKCLAKIFLHQ